MKFQCQQENLVKGLSVVSRAVANRSTLPVLSNVLLEVKEDGLQLSATNLELSITTRIGATVIELGAITVPARLLGELVSSLPKEPIDMALNERTKTLRIVCAKSSTNIKGIDAGEFPPLPVVTESSLTTTFDVVWFKEAINQVLIATADNELRSVLSGILFDFKADGLTLAATDGFRLSTKKLDATYEKEVGVIVPAKAIMEVVRLIVDETEPVRFSLANNQAVFTMSKTQLVSRLIEGTFPNYSHIIPKETLTHVTVKTQAFLSAVRRASFFAREAANVLKLTVTDSKMGHSNMF